MWIYTTSDINRPHLGSFPRKIGTRHYTLVLGIGRDGSTHSLLNINGNDTNSPRTSVHADRVDGRRRKRVVGLGNEAKADAGDDVQIMVIDFSWLCKMGRWQVGMFGGVARAWTWRS